MDRNHTDRAKEAQLRELTEAEFDTVSGGDIQRVAASTSAVGGMTAVIGMISVASYVVGLADGAKMSQK